MLALSAAMFGQFFFLTLFVQDVLGCSPLRAGIAFLPITAAIVLTSRFAARSLRIGPRLMATDTAWPRRTHPVSPRSGDNWPVVGSSAPCCCSAWAWACCSCP